MSLRVRSACALVALSVAAGSAHAAFFTNGSMDGPIGFSQVPTGWVNLPQGTTDTISAAGHPFSQFDGIGDVPFVNSSNGGTFAWSGDFFQDTSSQPEGLRQLVLNLTPGAQYEIAFEYANLGLYNDAGGIATNAFNAAQNYGSAGRWIVRTGIVEIGATPAEDFAPTAAQQVWKTFAFTFTAPQASIEFRFEANWVSGNGTHVGMGIDGISIREVPAPAPVTVLALVPAIGAWRRRR